MRHKSGGDCGKGVVFLSGTWEGRCALEVRQNNQIRELKRHIRELTAQLQSREGDRSCSSSSDASEDPPNIETSASGSEISSLSATSSSSSSKENDCRQAAAPDSIMAAAAALNVSPYGFL